MQKFRQCLRALLVAGCLACAVQAAAQTDIRLQSPVLIIDSNQLYLNSAYGKRVATEIEAANAELITENKRLETELAEEEKSLTDQRSTLVAADFKVLADEFDAKVRRIRSEQEAKARAIAARQDESRNDFLELSLPVLETLMNQAGAAVLLERRTVFISLSAIDVTSAAIQRIDAQIGDGTGASQSGSE